MIKSFPVGDPMGSRNIRKVGGVTEPAAGAVTPTGSVFLFFFFWDALEVLGSCFGRVGPAGGGVLEFAASASGGLLLGPPSAGSRPPRRPTQGG